MRHVQAYVREVARDQSGGPYRGQGRGRVTIDRTLNHCETDAVVADDVPAIRDATRRLIRAGHTSIAFVGGRSEVETSSERQSDYLAAMRKAGLNPVVAELHGSYRPCCSV